MQPRLQKALDLFVASLRMRTSEILTHQLDPGFKESECGLKRLCC